jgi:hypothetical protein
MNYLNFLKKPFYQLLPKSKKAYLELLKIFNIDKKVLTYKEYIESLNEKSEVEIDNSLAEKLYHSMDIPKGYFNYA